MPAGAASHVGHPVYCPGCAARGMMDTVLCHITLAVTVRVLETMHQPRGHVRLRCRRCRNAIALTLTRPEAT
jgi:hypothetical protein